MFLHQQTDIHINSIDAATHTTNIKTISNRLIPTHIIVTIPIKLTRKWITNTPCRLEMEIDVIKTIENPQFYGTNNSFER